MTAFTATKTDKERIVRAALGDGSTREWRFGLVQDKDGKWVLPGPAQVNREVKAYLVGIEATPVEPDVALQVELVKA